MIQPPIIYKYEEFSAQSLKNLKTQSIYFGSPLGFNDPYDCSLQAGIKEPTEYEISKLKNSYLERSDVPNEVKIEIQDSNVNSLKKMILRFAEESVEKQVDYFLNNNGVTCFSEKNDDLLMWSHYGGKYKGYCLGFSTEYDPFTKIQKVDYSDEMPTIDIIEVLMGNSFHAIVNLFCTKSLSWKYESEWRSFHRKAGTLFTYEADALKSIHFGPDIDNESLEIICLILADQNSEVKLHKGIRSKRNFKVDFNEFTYTSFIESQKMKH